MKALLNRIQASQASSAGWGLAILRIALGVVFFREGAQKFFGWFGGGGWASTCAYFTQLGIPFPEFNAFLVGGTEFFGGIALVTGLLTRLAAIPLAVTMVVAIVSAHLEGGWSYPLINLAGFLALIQAGAGPVSVDRMMSSKGARL